MVTEKSVGLDGLAENAVAPQASVQELTELGHSIKSTESLHEVSVGKTSARPTVFGTSQISAIRKNRQQELSAGDSEQFNLLTHCCCTGHWLQTTNRILWPWNQ